MSYSLSRLFAAGTLACLMGCSSQSAPKPPSIAFEMVGITDLSGERTLIAKNADGRVILEYPLNCSMLKTFADQQVIKLQIEGELSKHNALNGNVVDLERAITGLAQTCPANTASSFNF